MDNIEEIKFKLKQVGFTDNESKVFLVLLSSEQMSASEVAKEAKIRRTDIYDILKSFVDKGYCNEIETNTILQYEAIDPRVILDKLVHDIKINSKKRISNTESLFEQVLPLYMNKGISKSKKPNVELVRGFNKHRQVRFLELIKGAKEEVLMMNRIEGAVSKEADDLAQNLLKKGGRFKSIYEVSLNFKVKKDEKWKGVNLDEFLELCQFYQDNGEEVRITKMLTTTVAIFDREVVYMNVHDKDVPKHNKTDIIIRNKEFAQFFINIFDLCWNQSFTIDEFRELGKINTQNKN